MAFLLKNQPFFPLLLFFTCLCFLSTQGDGNSTQNQKNISVSLSFPLTSIRLSRNNVRTVLYPSLVSEINKNPRLQPKPTPSGYNFKTTFKYSMALIVALQIGTPPQTQQMVLDTGSQLSWIQCHKKRLPKSLLPPLILLFPLPSLFCPVPILSVSLEFPILPSLLLVTRIVYATTLISTPTERLPRATSSEKNLPFPVPKVPLL